MRIVLSSPSLARAARNVVAATAVIGVGLALGACSQGRQAGYDTASWAGAPPPVPAPQRQAAYEPEAGDPIKDAPIEPMRRAQPQPDDPSEPFSPNYGGRRQLPAAKVSDATPQARDREPDRVDPAAARMSDASRGYYRKASPGTTTAAAD